MIEMKEIIERGNRLFFSSRPKFFMITVMLFLLLLIICQSMAMAQENPIKKHLTDAKIFITEPVENNACIPDISFPLQLENINNFNSFLKKIPLDTDTLEQLKNYALAIIPTPVDFAEKEVRFDFSRESAYPKDDFIAYYQLLKDKDIPIFITSDSLLHYYHIFFDTTLMRLEEDLFYNDIWEISKELFFSTMYDFFSLIDNTLKEASRRNLAYFSVAMELLKPGIDQVISDEVLKEEYCFPGMDAERCNMVIAEMKEMYVNQAGKQYFSQEEAEYYNFYIPELAQNLVRREVMLIQEHKGWDFSPIFIYKEDYSQYVPRGHYTRSEKLKNYFKALMWFSRMTALIEGSPSLAEGESRCGENLDGIISEYDARIQTLQAFLLADKFIKSNNIQERWNRIYHITSFMVGFSDDLGPFEYAQVLQKLLTAEDGMIDPGEIAEKYVELKERIRQYPYEPKIYSGLGACELFMPCPPLSEQDIESLKNGAKKLLAQTKGFRLMGQRFTLDSWLFSEIVSPYSGEYTGGKLALFSEEKLSSFYQDDKNRDLKGDRPFTWVKVDTANCPPPASGEVRGFPRGLDLMALLGSERAWDILKRDGDIDYSNFEKAFTQLKEYIDSMEKEEWFSNLYNNWLCVLKALHGEFGKGYPAFMQTEAWQDKELNTTLASWAQLRHDTILYVKQSYTMVTKSALLHPQFPVTGYVEPVVEFYNRLLNLTNMTLAGFKELIPQQNLEKLGLESGLNQFADVLKRLLEISNRELENRPLDDSDYSFIENFGLVSANLIRTIAGGDVNSDALKTVMIADVHTEGNSKKVLEVGTGFIKSALVAYQLPQGHIVLGMGPVFSYYEFKQPMDNRLTDEAWREMLESGFK